MIILLQDLFHTGVEILPKNYKEETDLSLIMNPLSLQEKMEFESAIACGICGTPFEKDKIKDHFHVTGRKRFGFNM